MELIENEYRIGGVPVLDLVEQYGDPIFVYDASKIVSQYHRLKNAFAGCQVKIKYACKALNNINILKLLKNEGAGLDVVSINEARLGLMAGFLPDEILFTPNCVSFAEIQEAVELGIRINIDNISILEQFGHLYKNTVPCCIRINPHIVAGGNVHIQTGHIDSKFGISIHQMRHITRVVKSAGIKVNGLHMHTGSDILDAGVFLQGAELLFDAAVHFPDLEFIDFGSGFKVAYKEGDITTDIESLGKKIGESFQQFCKEYGKELELWFEPGKFLVSESGFLIVKTNVVKQTTATVFLGVNSGQNHLIRPMFYDAYHRIVNVSNPTGTPRIYTVVGYICETDTLGWDRSLSEVREGDVLAILNCGAYGYTMSNNYNARFRPAEILIIDGKPNLIRKAETMEDLIKNVVDIGLYYMKVLQLFDEVKTALQNIYSIEESNQIAKILFEDFNIAKGKDIIVYPEAIVNQENINLIRNSLLRLLNHEPIQYITGKAYFYENFFQVNSSTLIPRNETEELVEWIIHSNPTQKQMIDIIDLGTGSGCIAITLNQYYNQAHVTAVDISKDAIEVAKVNNRNLKTNVEFIIDNILNPSTNYQQYDIIVSNPPYVVDGDKKWMNSNVLDFEPYQALFVTNNDPLQFYRAIIKFSKKHLKTGGSIFCEIHENYAEITKQLFDEHYHEVILKKDLNGKYRMLKASLGI